ncbi:oxidoreductase [Streptomyces spiroverticillatus]|uniref:Oxidoreductase n=1 Tax=Streptomyces finlayi TaxID=67296 RepID=A0A918WU29_9ACTN|nr:zinc-binding dehydrogenase [Streptomyces finlayi]GGZ96162.1 oxidoreductase [Streptomyces spiroverticillatus]GHC81672.1 oxidoreductase [Streptomyces finlayi]
MHAIRLHAFGPAENLTYETTETPSPGPGQVRIAVTASGVHLLDTSLRRGEPGPFPAPPALPTVPGREVAGTVDALGEGTDPSWLGRRVVAHLGMPLSSGGNPQTPAGGYAESAVTDAAKLHPVPDSLTDPEAVAMIGTGRTTLGILGFTEVTADTVAVVPAAAGGIGTLLVQYVKHVGGTVIGLAGGPAKVALVEKNGADLAVDYLQPDWQEQVTSFLSSRGIGGATIVFDSVGGDTGLAAVDLLAPGGHHLVFGWSGKSVHDGEPLTFTEAELADRAITSEVVLGPPMLARAGGGPNPIRTLETRSLALAAEGVLRPAVQLYPLAEAARAHADLENRRTVGKVVLVP